MEFRSVVCLLVVAYHSYATEPTTQVGGPILVEHATDLSWTIAQDHCLSMGKSLCVRKNLCKTKTGTTLDGISENEMWVPILDGYDDWLYIGSDPEYKCRKLSDIHGPPSWNGENCSTIAGRDKTKAIRKFCSAVSNFYCCDKKEVPIQATNSAHIVHVFVKSREFKGENFYSYSKDKEATQKKWQIDQASWRNAGRLPGDVSRFALMSSFLKDQFEFPVFFCVRNITASGLPTTAHMISTRWCPNPWSLNFFLYASSNNATSSNKIVINAVGNGAMKHSRVTIKENGSFSNIVVYGPESKGGTLLAPQFVNGCGSKREILTSASGVISSPTFPGKYNGFTKKITCRWRITALKDQVIKITFKVLELPAPKRTSFRPLKPRRFQGGSNSEYDYNKTCMSDKVVMKGYGTFCGNQLPPTFFSTENTIDISLVGKRGTPEFRFALVYEAVSPANGLTRIESDKQLTWNSGQARCISSGKTLCSAKEICSVDGRPFYGAEQGDQWTPILNEYNDWVQIGRGNVITCQRHNKFHGPPLWGTDASRCIRTNTSHPCPIRNVVYCCEGKPNSTLDLGEVVNVKILSTVQNGIVFFKYIREGRDTDKSFDSSSIWSPKRKFKGDFTSIKMHSKYQPGVSKAIYFCSKRVVPAIGELKVVYSMFSQPCEALGWKLLYYLYSLDRRRKNTIMHYVGIYEKWPYHSRVHFRRFPTGFQSDNGYILYSYVSPDSLPDEGPIDRSNEGCSSNTSIIEAPVVLESPGYPVKYANNLHCQWHLKMPEVDEEKGNKLKLTIEELDLENPVDILVITEVAPDKDLDKTLDIRNRNYDVIKKREFSGQVNGLTLETTGAFLLVLKTDGTVRRKGFKVKIEVVRGECGGEITESGQEITSPNYPYFYKAGLNCNWIVRAPSPEHDIEVQVKSFDLVHEGKCLDSLQIVEEHAASMVFCGGEKVPKKMVFSANSVRIIFNTKTRTMSGPVNAGKGFFLRVNFNLRKAHENTSNSLQCGIQTVPLEERRDRIVDGLVAENGNFPWVVMVGKPRVVCGGSLVNERWVLTATHCFVSEYYKSTGIMVMQDALSNFKIIAGRYRRNIPSQGEQHFNISDIYVHSGYTRYRVRWNDRGSNVIGIFPYNDITLARLRTKAVFSPTVSPICLPAQDAHVGDFCYVAGWGSEVPDSVVMVSELNYAKVPILDNSLCNSWSELEGTIMENVICAGFPEGGNDHCWGDSGGPLMCRGRYGNYYVNGIVSWSRVCGGKRTPGIYTRVWPFFDWISDIIKDV